MFHHNTADTTLLTSSHDGNVAANMMRNATVKVGLLRSLGRKGTLLRCTRCVAGLGMVHRLSTRCSQPVDNDSRFAERMILKKSKWTNTRVAEKRLEIFASRNEMHASPLANLYHRREIVQKVKSSCMGQTPITSRFWIHKSFIIFTLSYLYQGGWQRHKNSIYFANCTHPSVHSPLISR